MAILSKNSALMPNFFYTPYRGSLCFLNTRNHPVSTECREVFHQNLCLRSINEFYYVLKPKQTVEDILNYLDKVEKKIGLKKESEFFRIKNDFSSEDRIIIKIKPNWWKDNVRLELLTIYLRSIQGNTLSNNKYVKKTKKAINHFINGNVYFNGNIFTGWVHVFSENKNLNLLTNKKKENKVKFFHSYEFNLNQE